MAEINYANVRKAVGNGDATLLLLRILHLTEKEKGGVMIDGRRWSYRSTPEWGEVVGISEHQTRRHMHHLTTINMVETRMAWVGKGAFRRYVLHVSPTDKARAILHGEEGQIGTAPEGDFAPPPSADLHHPPAQI